ncbi:signal peptide peptidase SppA [Buchnera aphidicola]|uniref:Protease IV, a signal peptide peptidase n=1 Tax=Buchnera aphidicola subsp. Cinara cedri (strain Cc) TaxID=372461 RepID=Q057Q6_BUCCC|nr:signal peptide peptidase SppA [Buchnera aphidicola]ABJ90643.1 protease IV, a signal peptide peptidase [Buchnera aphidicola BCc]
MKIFFLIILKIFKFISITYNLIKKIFLNIFILLFLSIFVLLIYEIKKKNIFFSKNNKSGILVIDLNQTLKEEPIRNISLYKHHNYFLNFFNWSNNSSVYEITKKIEQAKEDPKIKGIQLNFSDSFTSNQVILEYFGKKLYEFKQSNKPIISIGKNYSQSGYYLASFSNKIFLLPDGSVHINGIANTKIFLKKIIDTLKIHLHVFRIGKYKNAVESVLRNSPSKINKKIDQLIIRFKWKKYLQKIASNRNTVLTEICPNPNIFTKFFKKKNNNYTKYALYHNLVDKILKKNSIKKYLNNFFKNKDKNYNYNFININNYYINKKKITLNSNKIKVIISNGIIENNCKRSANLNIENLLNEIDEAKNDSSVKAVILRINSPGGTVKYSEIIRKKLLELHKCNKPLIISMGDVCASGGYWISTAGDYIIAHDTTLTGSIGIFAVIPTIEKILSTIGIKQYQIKTKYYEDFSIFHELSEQSKKSIGDNIIREYKKFITIVAQSRKLSYKKTHSISQGRVWTGYQAQKIGLVDEIGDLDHAIKKAAQLANIKNYCVIWSKLEKKSTANVTSNMNNSINIKQKNILNMLIKRFFINKNLFEQDNLYLFYKIIFSKKIFSLCLENFVFK